MEPHSPLFAGALQRFLGRSLVVAVAVSTGEGKPIEYYGVLQTASNDYIVLVGRNIERYIPHNAIVSVYVHAESGVTAASMLRAKQSAKRSAKML